MKVIESGQYREAGEQAGDILRQFGGRLDGEERHELELRKKMAEVHAELESVTGTQIAVANDTGDAHLAGFLTVDDRKIHIVEGILGDPELARKVVLHEKEHKDHVEDGIREIDFKKHLSAGEFGALERIMGGVNVGELNWIEGFTEFITAGKHGKNCECAYNHKEVPAVERLENLCKKEMGVSVVEAFDGGDLALLYEHVRTLARILMVKDSLLKAA